MINIILADDHQVVRKGLKALLASEPEFSVIGEANDGLEALQLAERLQPDVLVLDLMMAGINGLEVTRQLSKKIPKIAIVILSMHSNEAYVQESLRSGDPEALERGIAGGLQLPLFAMKTFIALWVFGLIPIVLVGSLVSGSLRESVSAVATDILAFLIAMSIAIFTVVEAHCRPMLRRLYDAVGDDFMPSTPYRIGIPLRVIVVITVTIISTTLMLSSGAIGAAIGAEGPGRGEVTEIVRPE